MSEQLRSLQRWFRARPRRLTRLKYGLIALALLIGMALAARPIVHSIKSWQARKLAAEANTLMQNQQWREATRKALDAAKLRPNEPAALEAVAHLLSRTGQSAAALDWWKKIEGTHPLGVADRREYAGAALGAGELATAENQIETLLKEKDVAAEDLALAAQLKSLRGEPAAALNYARQVWKSPNASPLAAFNAAVLIIANTAPQSPEYDAAVDRLIDLARSEQTTVALEALRLLAANAPRARLTNPGSSPLVIVPPAHPTKTITREEVAQLLEKNPGAVARDQLVALQLRAETNRLPVNDYTRTAIELFGKDDTAAAALAGWLYDRGQFEKVLEIASLDRATRSRPLYLWRVDALAALGRFPELKEMLITEYSALDQVSQHIFLAIVSAKLSEPVTATNEWERALEAANTTRKLQMLAHFAEASNVPDIADKACVEILTRNPRLRSAYTTRLRLAEAAGNTAGALKIAQEINRLWPHDLATGAREVYLRLLLGESPQDATVAKKLEEARSAASLGWNERASLALAELRNGHPSAALSTLDQPGPGMPPPSVSTVRAQALAATGWKDKARDEAGKLTTAKLLPEERALIAPLLSDQRPAESH